MRVMVIVKATRESEAEITPGDEKLLKETGAFGGANRRGEVRKRETELRTPQEARGGLGLDRGAPLSPWVKATDRRVCGGHPGREPRHRGGARAPRGRARP